MAGVLINLCPPALIYIIYSITQIGIDTARGEYNTAFLKFWVAIVFTFLLNHLCSMGLGIISWLIVFIPFILIFPIIIICLFPIAVYKYSILDFEIIFLSSHSFDSSSSNLSLVP